MDQICTGLIGVHQVDGAEDAMAQRAIPARLAS